MKNIAILFSCEHYSSFIPKEFNHLFNSVESKKILQSHRGWDIGIPIVVNYWENFFQQTVFKAEVSRLIVDLNRSRNHKNLFSEFSNRLSSQEKQEILKTYYDPYRSNIEEIVENNSIHDKITLHIALHSFTGVWNGTERNADIGILYDPSHILENRLSQLWKSNLKKISNLRVRSNYPYLGRADSFPTYLRKKYNNNYIGIELEINQSMFSESGKKLLNPTAINNVIESFHLALKEMN